MKFDKSSQKKLQSLRSLDETGSEKSGIPGCRLGRTIHWPSCQQREKERERVSYIKSQNEFPIKKIRDEFFAHSNNQIRMYRRSQIRAAYFIFLSLQNSTSIMNRVRANKTTCKNVRYSALSR